MGNTENVGCARKGIGGVMGCDAEYMHYITEQKLKQLEQQLKETQQQLEKAEEVIHSLNKIKQIALSNSLKVKKYNIAIENYFKEKDN